MISLQNPILLVTCLETGAELALLDKKRGTRWLLDPHSLAYGAGVAGRGGRGEPEPDLKPLVPAIDLSRETIEVIKALGFDIAPWSWLNEDLPASPEAVRHLYRRDPDGQIMPNWKIDEQQWNWMCYSYMPPEGWIVD